MFLGVAWTTYVLVHAVFLADRFSFFQNFVILLVSVLVAGALVVGVWIGKEDGLKPDKEPRGWRTPEFLLVVVMLISLTALVVLVFEAPIPEAYATNTTASQVLDYRKSILAVILTAFGAWIGAGAAYYFGRENLSKATESILAMREPTPREFLRQKSVMEVPLKPLDWLVKRETKVWDVWQKLRAEDERWFVPIVRPDGTLETVIHEESVYRFIDQKGQDNSGQTVDALNSTLKNTDLNELLDWMDKVVERKEKGPDWLKRMKDIHVLVTKDTSVGDAMERMDRKHVFLAIVTDEQGRPVQWFTTSEVRQLILQIS